MRDPRSFVILLLFSAFIIRCFFTLIAYLAYNGIAYCTNKY